MNSLERFGQRAESYATFRPSYPADSIDTAIRGLGDPSTLVVADIGAGTGISSRLFAERGARVIAIEPNAKMRSQAEPHANVRWSEGTALQTGLPDASVDLAVACQAFHWFATPEVMREFRRVARRRAALLQYERDEKDEFTKAYGDVVRVYATDDTEALRRRALEVFAAYPDATVTRSTAHSEHFLDRAALLGRASSASYLPSTGPEAAALRSDLNELFERYARDGQIALRTIVYTLTADW